MGDDLDDLLNEVESKFCATKLDPSRSSQKQAPVNNPKMPAATSRTEPSIPAGKRNTKSGRDAELNSMIDDIFEDSIPDLDASPVRNTRPRSSANPNTAPVSKGSGTSKCFPVTIGGSKYPRGLSTAVHPRTCDKLRCTDCDFAVEMFDGVCWHPDTDYLFLRNNMPEYERVKSNLLKRGGWRAYACQCKSKSVEDKISTQETNLKWVCGKH